MRVFAVFLALSVRLFASDPYVDLSGDWKLIRDGSNTTVDMPLDAAKQPAGRYRIERGAAPLSDVGDLAFVAGALHGSYRVYINGTVIGEIGEMGSIWSPPAASRLFVVPPKIVSPGEPITIAIDVDYPQRFTRGQVPESAPVLLTSRRFAELTVQAATHKAQLKAMSMPVYVFAAFFLALAIWLATRSGRDSSTIHWLVAAILWNAIYDSALLVSRWGLDLVPEQVLAFVLVTTIPLVKICSVEFCARMVELRVPGWMRGLFYVVLFAVFQQTGFNGIFRWAVTAAELACLLAAFQKRKQRDVLVVVFLVLAYDFIALVAGPFAGWDVGPVTFNRNPVMRILLALGVTIELLRRSAHDRSERARLAGELEAARQVQSLLVTSSAVPSNRYVVDAAYLPAQEVGGDFYQVWQQDEALLVAVGDVSGKGLKAAMTVSLIVGALRRETSSSPGEILANLNRVVLQPQDKGFVTCCVIRLDWNGEARIACAGHPAPWHNGAEVELTPALPLGIAADLPFDEATLRLVPGDEIAIVSDGVVEAANARGELFGFEQARKVIAKAANEVAAAAQAWGQNDDITVLTVRRAL